MLTIGMIAPHKRRLQPLRPLRFWERHQPHFIFNETHRVTLVVAYDNQNYNRIFKKQQVSAVVCADGVCLKDKLELPLCDGWQFFQKHLFYFTAKAFKLYGLSSNTAVVCLAADSLDDGCESFMRQAAKLFRYLLLSTDNEEQGRAMAELMFTEYGISVSVIPRHKPVQCDVLVVLADKAPSAVTCRVTVSVDAALPSPPDCRLKLPHYLPFSVNPMALSEALCRAKNIDKS